MLRLPTLHAKSSTSFKIKNNLTDNKNFSCLLCNSRSSDASSDKYFDSTKSDNCSLGTYDVKSNYCEFFNNCKYFDATLFNSVVKYRVNELFIIHFNVRSLQKNIDKLITFLAEFSEKPDIIAISETKIKCGQPLLNVNISGYSFIHCDSVTNSGGVGFYIKQTLIYKQKSEININLSFVENMCIEVKTTTGPIVIGVVYRHPTKLVNDYECFTKNLYDIFAELRANNTVFYAVGDYNIDLLQINTNQTIRKYANEILGTSTSCVIDLPTRISHHSRTLLDHIYVNDIKNSFTSGVLICDLSDHFPTFVCISTKKIRAKSTTHFAKRDMKNFKLQEYLSALNHELNAANLDSFDSAHEAFDKFDEVFQNIVNKFAPIKKVSRREKKLSQKPWMSRELLNLIKQKNILFKQLHRKYDKDIFEKYKKQRNALNREIARAKKTYYKNLVADNKGNSSMLWKVIGELANLKKSKRKFPNEIVTKNDSDAINDPQKICEAFNDYFSTIGEKIGKNIISNDSIPSVLPNLPNSFFSPLLLPKRFTLLLAMLK